MRLYIVRHGRTDWNEKGLIQGSADIELNSVGIAQAEKAKSELADVDIDLCICSPLKRAKKTAEILVGGKCPIEEDSDIMEIKCGKYEGKLMTDIPWQEYWKGELEPEEDGIESMKDLTSRLDRFLGKLGTEYKGKKFLIVSHGGAIRVLRQMLHQTNAKSTFKDEIVKNCEICIYDI